MASTLEDAGFAGLVPTGRSIINSWAAIETMAEMTTSLRFVHTVSLAGHELVLDAAHRCLTMPTTTRSRMSLAVGTGWTAEEFEYLGSDHGNDGPRLAAMIDALRTEWRGETTGPMSPIPLMGDGESAAALQRAARHCDGWMGAPMPWGRAVQLVQTLHRYLREYGRTADTFTIIVSPREEPSPDICRQARDIGVTGLGWSPWTSRGEATAAIDMFAERIAAHHV